MYVCCTNKYSNDTTWNSLFLPVDSPVVPLSFKHRHRRQLQEHLRPVLLGVSEIASNIRTVQINKNRISISIDVNIWPTDNSFPQNSQIQNYWTTLQLFHVIENKLLLILDQGTHLERMVNALHLRNAFLMISDVSSRVRWGLGQGRLFPRSGSLRTSLGKNKIHKVNRCVFSQSQWIIPKTLFSSRFSWRKINAEILK